MLFNRQTKIFATFESVSNEADLALLNAGNTFPITDVSMFQEQATPALFSFVDSANGLGEVVNRGVDTRAGLGMQYTITLNTYLGLVASKIISNQILFEAMLTGKQADSLASSTGVLVNNSNFSQLKELAIIVVVGNLVQVYTHCIVNSLTLDLNITSLAGCSWSLLAGRHFTTGLLSLDGSGRLVYDSTIVSAEAEKAELISGKLAITEVVEDAQPTVELASTGTTIQFTHNATIIVDNAIGRSNRFLGYKLGAFAISGAVQVYIRDGIRPFLDRLSTEYNSGGVPRNKDISFTIFSQTRRLKISIGKCYFPPTAPVRGPILTAPINYTANNHKNNSLTIEKL